jgi:L-iditol 2-dehydrogenase
VKQAVLTGNEQIEMGVAPRPAPGPNQVLIEIAACGICGSDLHIYKGGHPTIKPPTVMGHEFAGRIVEVGQAVKTFQVGDYVAGIPGVGCGTCEPCVQGKFNLCRELKVIGGYYPGAFAEYTLVPESNLVKIPEHFTAVEGAMIESVAVAVHVVRRMESIAGKKFAVLGAGPIGILVIQVLKAFGAKLVITSDPIEGRREIAGQLGADIVINPMNEQVEERVRKEVGDLGLDGAVDCAGIELTFHQALNITKNGGEIVITALFGKNPEFPIRLLQRGEKKLLGTQMYVKEDFETAIQLVNDGKVKLDSMVTHQFDLDHTAEAFRVASSRSADVGKVVIDIKGRQGDSSHGK